MLARARSAPLEAGVPAAAPEQSGESDTAWHNTCMRIRAVGKLFVVPAEALCQCRFRSTRWQLDPGATRTTSGFGIRPSFKDHSVSRRAKPLELPTNQREVCSRTPPSECLLSASATILPPHAQAPLSYLSPCLFSLSKTLWSRRFATGSSAGCVLERLAARTRGTARRVRAT
jgi:hypothetical protein